MPRTLLLADDSITIQRVVGITFANEDYEITTVDNGDDAVAKAKEIKPDIILADVIMPKKNGYEVCEAIHGDPELTRIPVLLLAGTFEAFDENRAREVGAAGYITKPFESQALIDKVNQLVKGGAAPLAAEAKPAAPHVPPPHAPPPHVPASVAPRPGVPKMPPGVTPLAPAVAVPRPPAPLPARPAGPAQPMPGAAPAMPPRAQPAAAAQAHSFAPVTPARPSGGAPATLTGMPAIAAVPKPAAMAPTTFPSPARPPVIPAVSPSGGAKAPAPRAAAPFSDLPITPVRGAPPVAGPSLDFELDAESTAPEVKRTQSTAFQFENLVKDALDEEPTQTVPVKSDSGNMLAPEPLEPETIEPEPLDTVAAWEQDTVEVGPVPTRLQEEAVALEPVEQAEELREIPSSDIDFAEPIPLETADVFADLSAAPEMAEIPLAREEAVQFDGSGVEPLEEPLALAEAGDLPSLAEPEPPTFVGAWDPGKAVTSAPGPAEPIMLPPPLDEPPLMAELEPLSEPEPLEVAEEKVEPSAMDWGMPEPERVKLTDTELAFTEEAELPAVDMDEAAMPAEQILPLLPAYEFIPKADEVGHQKMEQEEFAAMPELVSPEPLEAAMPVHDEPGLGVAPAIPLAAQILSALPVEELRKIAREVMTEIAWEVVPQLAEAILREEIEKLVQEKLAD